MQGQGNLYRAEDLAIPQGGDGGNAGIVTDFPCVIQFDLGTDLTGAQLDGIADQIFAVFLAQFDLISVGFAVIGEHGVDL